MHINNKSDGDKMSYLPFASDQGLFAGGGVQIRFTRELMCEAEGEKGENQPSNHDTDPRCNEISHGNGAAR